MSWAGCPRLPVFFRDAGLHDRGLPADVSSRVRPSHRGPVPDGPPAELYGAQRLPPHKPHPRHGGAQDRSWHAEAGGVWGSDRGRAESHRDGHLPPSDVLLRRDDPEAWPGAGPDMRCVAGAPP